jgi:hypothetical protein
MGHPLKLPSPTKLARLGHFPPASQEGRLAGPVFYNISFLFFFCEQNIPVLSTYKKLAIQCHIIPDPQRMTSFNKEDKVVHNALLDTHVSLMISLYSIHSTYLVIPCAFWAGCQMSSGVK